MDDVVHGSKMFEALDQHKSQRLGDSNDAAGQRFGDSNDAVDLSVHASSTPSTLCMTDNWWDDSPDDWDNLHISTTDNTPRTPTKYTIIEEEWGTEHPEFQKSNRRISWSVQEKQFIKNWLDQNQHQIKNRASQLLKNIRENKSSHKIFHVNHIVDSTRIRHGIRIVQVGEKSNNAIYYSEIY
jgi:hypothetical protein